MATSGDSHEIPQVRQAASGLSDGEFSGEVSGLSQICVYVLVNSRLFTGK